MNGYLSDKSRQHKCLVIGNGESRQSLNISNLNLPTIGCNAIHRDMVCDHIIAVDLRMVREILSNPFYSKTPIYTRSNWINQFNKHPNINLVPELPYKGDARPDDPWHWGSGPYAVLLAAQRYTVVNMIGFDLYSQNNLVNNVYKGTQNYSKLDSRSVDYSYWVYQVAKVFENYPLVTFNIFNYAGWKLPPQWNFHNINLHFYCNETTNKYFSKALIGAKND